METKLLNGNNKEAIAEASKILQDGGLVAFPTETVYGLGADALNADAAAKIYAAKGRPSDNPLIVHIADTNAVEKLADLETMNRTHPDMVKKAHMLMEAFWPGPLTIIFPKLAIVPDGTTGGLPTVAIRMPSHPIAQELIRTSGVSIAAPSANTSGRPSPTTAQHVWEDMDGRIEMILDGGAVGIGIESTIVDMTGTIPTILRPGFITKTMLSEIVGDVTIDPAIIEPDPESSSESTRHEIYTLRATRNAQYRGGCRRRIGKPGKSAFRCQGLLQRDRSGNIARSGENQGTCK